MYKLLEILQVKKERIISINQRGKALNKIWGQVPVPSGRGILRHFKDKKGKFEVNLYTCIVNSVSLITMFPQLILLFNCTHCTNVHKQVIMAFSGPLGLFYISDRIFFLRKGKKTYYFRRGMVPIFGPKKWPNKCPGKINLFNCKYIKER